MDREVKANMINIAKIFARMNFGMTEKEFLEILESSYDNIIKEKEEKISHLNSQIYYLKNKVSEYEQMGKAIRSILDGREDL